ncbi:hypothetical protein Drorol1_Dr00024729, partial [Drosera rotundifolia]
LGYWVRSQGLVVEFRSRSLSRGEFGVRLFESGKPLFVDLFKGVLLPCVQLELGTLVLRSRGTGGGLFECVNVSKVKSRETSSK